jgi:hypothetical protein
MVWFAHVWLAHNLLAWMVQTVLFASVAALLPILFRVRHPKTQLYYCHAALIFCLILPAIQPWRISGSTMGSQWQWLWLVLAAGVLIQLLWMSNGLLRIRRYRIAATPLYPVPDAMRAASAITQADALFCVSEEASGPVMMGWLAPVVLLPPAFLDLDEEAQCGIACHELLHVRRGDWMITLIEELAGSLLWFNPGAWLLLSEARLAREQLVDAESVRLTASREPYIDALMSMARAHTWSDLVPAPSFLRRSHLTQRMQSLLSDTPASSARVIASYGSILLLLGCSAWASCAAFPMLSHPPAEIVRAVPTHQPAPALPVAPAIIASNAQPVVSGNSARRGIEAEPVAIPPITDPHEPIGPAVEPVSSPMERSAALSLLARARQRALRHVPGTPPYRFTVSFQAAGSVLETGPGELTETWMNGQLWRLTASLGGVSHARLRAHGQLLEDRHIAVIPMRAQMLRNEVLWGTRGLGNNIRMRTARVESQGRTTTCLLVSDNGEDAEVAEAAARGRAWGEEEYCMDDATATLIVHSIAPGTYALFTYGGAPFHGYSLPDAVQIYVNTALAVDSKFSIVDATSADAESLTPAAGMTSTPAPIGLVGPFYASTQAGPAVGTQPVVVHSEIDGDGNVVESELSAAANPGLFQAALEHIRTMKFGQTGAERQAYITVWF